MALTTYSDLQTQVANWLARDDLTAYIPDFITLFECAAVRRLRVRLQETTTTLTPISGTAALPTDFLGARRVTWAGSPIHELNYVAPSVYADYLESGSGTPGVYTIEAANLKVAPSSDSSITLEYYQKTAAVSGSLNWLWTRHPDAYLFGTLCEANAFNKGKAFETASLWKQRRDEVFDEIQRNEFWERPMGSVRVMGVTP